MESVKDRIAAYVDHLDDIDYLRALYRDFENNVIIAALAELLQHTDHVAVGFVLLFIRDAVLVGQSLKNRAFGEAIYKITVPQIEALLFSENHFIRGHAVYCLGKLVSKTSIPQMQLAFERFRSCDPLLLDGLVFELQWLGANNQWTLIDRLVGNPYYLIRWAALGILAERYQRQYVHYYRRHFRHLSHDSNPLVCAEAIYCSEYCPKWESFKQSKLKRISAAKNQTEFYSWIVDPDARFTHQSEPRLTWTAVSNKFRSELYNSGKIDYTLGELDQFVQAL